MWKTVHASVKFFIDWLLAEPVKAFLVSIAIIGLHLLIPLEGRFAYLSGEFWASFTRDVGIGLLVSVFIAIAVERSHHELRDQEFRNHLKLLADRDGESRKFVEQVAINTFKSIYQLDVPENWFEDFVDMISGNGLLRLDHISNIFIDSGLGRNEPEQNGIICYKVEVRYRMKNCSSRNIEYDFAIFIKKRDELNEFERHIKVLDAKIDDRSILESEFALLDSDQFKKFSKVVPMSPGEIKSFEFHYQGVRRIRDHLIWSLNTSGSGVDFWIRPSNRIVVSAHFYHPSQAIEQIETSTNAMPIRINIRKPVMARTPLEINWRPRTTT